MPDERTDAEFFLDALQSGYMVWNPTARRWKFSGHNVDVFNEPTWESMIVRLKELGIWRSDGR